MNRIPEFPGREHLPGQRVSRDIVQSNSEENETSAATSLRHLENQMQYNQGYSEWNSNQYGQQPQRSSALRTISRPGNSNTNVVDADRTPLPRVRNQNTLPPPSPFSPSKPQQPRFWTPQTESPNNAAGNPTPNGANKILQKFLSSFRRSQTQNPQKSSGSLSDKSPKPATEDVSVRILLLDGEELSMSLNKRSLGMDMMQRLCDGQDIIETDYFGLTYTDKKLGTWFWLDLEKKIIKQLPNISDWHFYFQVRFYPPEPTMLQDETTRYQLALQVRQDIFTGKLPCSWVTQALLGSFQVQSELGDYDPTAANGSTEYLKQFEFVRNPTEQLLQKIAELHATHLGMKPGQADIKYLETAKRLDLYGLDLHPARDMENVEIHIGVGFSGVVVYRDRIRIGRFAWPKVLRISYKKDCFYLKIRPDYTEPEEVVVGFLLMNPQLAKRLWKAAVDHHAFFRLKEPRFTKKGSLNLLLGSQYQYSGRTFFQYRTTDSIERSLEFDDEKPHQLRTAGLPSGLIRAGLLYNSVHSLNRTHPRDMTVGKAFSNDYLGPTRAQPLQNDIPSKTNNRTPIPTRTIPNTRPKQSPPISRRGQRVPIISESAYQEADGSLFDGASSRGDGSLVGSGLRSEEYEVPRNLSATQYSSYDQEEERPERGSEGFRVVGGGEAVDSGWSASASYNPRGASPQSWSDAQSSSRAAYNQLRHTNGRTGDATALNSYAKYPPQTNDRFSPHCYEEDFL